MRVAAAFRHLARTDTRLIGRDALLSFLLLYIVIIILAARWGVPPLGRWLHAAHGFDLAPYHPLVVAYVSVLVAPMLIGFMMGFLMLDEKEDGTLRALLVTPLPLATYLLYRISVPTVLTALFVPLAVWGLDLGAPPWPAVLLVAAVNAPLGAASTLFYPVFASDKVRAFVLAKIVSGAAFLPIAAYFIAPPWQYLAAVFPPFWTVKALWLAMAGDPGWGIHLGLGALATWGTLAFMAERFRRAAVR